MIAMISTTIIRNTLNNLTLRLIVRQSYQSYLSVPEQYYRLITNLIISSIITILILVQFVASHTTTTILILLGFRGVQSAFVYHTYSQYRALMD
jgi:hypothetical protein